VIEKAITPRTAGAASRMITLPHMMTRRLRWARTEWTHHITGDDTNRYSDTGATHHITGELNNLSMRDI
jgi:hypothetical protein